MRVLIVRTEERSEDRDFQRALAANFFATKYFMKAIYTPRVPIKLLSYSINNS
jgi:hypothetical protein